MDELNMPLRAKILELSLFAEGHLTDLLAAYLSLFNEDRKALTNKSGSLSAKNRVDLLYDLEVLDKEEHGYFVLLAEFRNQFAHNAECSSFEAAVRLLGTERGKRLLRLSDSPNDVSEEGYLHAFQQLYIKCNQITQTKIKQRFDFINNTLNVPKTLRLRYVVFIDLYYDLVSRVFELCEDLLRKRPEVVSDLSIFLEEFQAEVERSKTAMDAVGTETSDLIVPETLIGMLAGRKIGLSDRVNDMLVRFDE